MASKADSNGAVPIAELHFLLKVLMLMRVVTVTLFLGVTVVVQIKGTQTFFFAPLFFIYLLIVAVYLVTIFFAAIFSQVSNVPRFAIIQVGVDLVVATLVVFFSGGFDSPLAFMFLFPVLWASLALKGGGYWTASFSSILYGVVVDLQFYGVISPPYMDRFSSYSLANPWDMVGRVALHMTAFFAVAFLGHQMSSRYRRTREELTVTTSDLEKLKSLSDVVFESITSGVIVVDDRIRVRSLNRSGRMILDPEGKGLSRESVDEMFGDIPVADLCERASEGGVHRWEGSFNLDGGEDRIMGLSISPLVRPEEGYVIIFQDLTDLRAMEDKLKTAEKLSAMGRMAASIAHEIRNPLASMSGSIQILKGSLDLAREDEKLMSIVTRETERLNGLVSDFLSYARPPSPRFEDVDLKELLLDTVNFMGADPGSGNIKMDLDLPPHKVILSVDADQVRQVIINLVRNAMEASGPDGSIFVSLEKEGEQGSEVTTLQVADEGPGIPEEVMEEVFEPFVTTKPGGTGLGLAIVYQLVQIHQGTVMIDSEPGTGTTVKVKLPAWRAA
jgi:two-component system sensor histidine kinase PilS (NtrC family)